MVNHLMRKKAERYVPRGLVQVQYIGTGTEVVGHQVLADGVTAWLKWDMARNLRKQGLVAIIGWSTELIADTLALVEKGVRLDEYPGYVCEECLANGEVRLFTDRSSHGGHIGACHRNQRRRQPNPNPKPKPKKKKRAKKAKPKKEKPVKVKEECRFLFMRDPKTGARREQNDGADTETVRGTGQKQPKGERNSERAWEQAKAKTDKATEDDGRRGSQVGRKSDKPNRVHRADGD